MTAENPDQLYFVKAERATGKILGFGILSPANAASVITSPADQVVMETREAVIPGMHVYVDLETHDLLGQDMRPVPPPTERPLPAMDSGGEVVFLPPIEEAR